jgi:hypothetical protein
MRVPSRSILFLQPVVLPSPRFFGTMSVMESFSNQIRVQYTEGTLPRQQPF